MKRTGIWTCLERFLSPATVLVEWRTVLGLDFDNAKSFLRATPEQADEYPCTNRPPCDCAHEIIPHGPDRIVAACRCDPGDCKTIRLQPRDVVIHALDARKFCRAIRRAFKFDTPPDERAILYGAPNAWPVGTYGALHSPVYLVIRPTEPEFLKEIEGLITGQADPFILLAPTQRHRTPTVQAVLQRHHSVFIPLSRTLAFDGPGRFKANNPIYPILDRFTAALTAGNGLVKTVEKFGRDLDAVAKGNYELRKENDELRQLQADGYLRFALRVDGEDFRAFAVIMVLGTRKAAADFLGVPHRSFYDRVEKWPSRGKEYQKMTRAVEWRKSVGRRRIVPLGDAMQSGDGGDTPANPETMKATLDRLRDNQVDTRDYPALLGDILAALEALDAENWPAVRKELIGIIKEELPQ